MAHIAVIDDDPTTFELLEVALGPRHVVNGYASGRAALDGLLRVPPELVLLDINLGDMSGVDLVRAIREHPAVGDIPIFAITAYTEDSVRAALMAEGFTAFIAKPIRDVAELVRTIEAALVDEEAAWNPSEPPSPLRQAARLALVALENGDAAAAETLLRRALAAEEGGLGAATDAQPPATRD